MGPLKILMGPCDGPNEPIRPQWGPLRFMMGPLGGPIGAFCWFSWVRGKAPHFWASAPKGAKPSHLITYGCSFRPSVHLSVRPSIHPSVHPSVPPHSILPYKRAGGQAGGRAK